MLGEIDNPIRQHAAALAAHGDDGDGDSLRRRRFESCAAFGAGPL